MRKKTNAPEKNFQAIADNWAKIQALPIRERIKHIRTITFDIYNTYKQNKFSAKELATFIDILKNSIQATSLSSRFSILLNKITAEWLTLTGNDNVEILTKINGKITVESGMIVLFDAAKKDLLRSEIQNDFSETKLLQQINQGNFFAFSTGGDGVFNAQIRVINASEPVLSAKEISCIKAASSLAKVEFPSGNLILDDLSGIQHSSQGMNQSITPGLYQVKVFYFLIPNKVESFYIVLCKDSGSVDNALTRIDDLGNF